VGIPRLAKTGLIAGVLILGFGSALARAGPPFLTDDPEPVDFHHWEAYFFSSYDATRIGKASQGPAYEMNWGPVPDVQLHLVIPGTASVPAQGPAAFGMGDTEVGVKYRFIHETAHRPDGSTWYRLPLWVQKSFGPWTSYGGAGEVLNRALDTNNYTFGGWLLQRDIGKRWTLGGEVFAHGAEGAATLSTHASTLADFGGYYYIHKPGFQVLFMAGHSVAGQAETVAYLGLYWTWGPEQHASPSARLPGVAAFR
jgi:hypothetical protein